MIVRPNSIRLRLFLFALAGIAVALALAGYALTELFGRHLDRRLAQELDGVIGQLAGNVRIDPSDGRLRLATEPADLRFKALYSGLYWEVRDEAGRAPLRSRSLWDAELPLPAAAPAPGESLTAEVEAPEGGDLKLRETRIVVASPDGERMLRISAGINRAESEELVAGFARDLLPGLGLLGVALLVGAWVQSGAGLRPVARVGAGVQAVRDRRSARLDGDVPREIRPLVDEMNRLLERQEADMRRAQDRAADLAHGLKTPLTALASDIARLRQRGELGIADDLDALAARMRRTVERELVRVRQRYQPGTAPPAPVVAAADAIARILKRTPAGEVVTVRVGGDTGLAAAIDRDDLNEVLGNLMENAVRHAGSRVDVSVGLSGARIVVDVADDGEGADQAQLARLAERGRRHDETGGAAGLGLAIAADILALHGEAMEFDRAAQGGLSVRFCLPASGIAPSPP